MRNGVLTRLTPREQQVLRHVRAGASNKVIATTLGISEQSVKAIVSRLLLKYRVPNRTMLVTHAERRPGPHVGRDLHEALGKNRALRDRNRQLMALLRSQMRSFRGIRGRIAGSVRDASSAARLPRAGR